MKYFTAMNKSRTKKSEEGQKIRGRRHKHVTPELGKQKGTDHLKDLETDGSVLSKCIVSDCEDSLRQLSVSREHGSKTSGATKGRKFRDTLND